MESNDGYRNKDDENTKEKERLRSSFLPHWSYILLTAIIIAISSVVVLLLLPYYIQGNDGPSAVRKIEYKFKNVGGKYVCLHVNGK